MANQKKPSFEERLTLIERTGYKRPEGFRGWIHTNSLPMASLVVSALVGFGSLGYTVWKDMKASRSNEARFASIESSLRILTQTVAPQIYKSINDSLHYALNQDNSNVGRTLDSV